MYCSLIGYCPDERPLLLKYPISGFSKTNSLALKPSCGESFFVLNTSLLEVVGDWRRLVREDCSDSGIGIGDAG